MTNEKKYIVTIIDDGSRQSEECIRELECEWGAEEIEAQPQDAVSRKAIMQMLDDISSDFDTPREAIAPIDSIADAIADLPSVIPQRKKGKWIDNHKLTHYVCSECQNILCEKTWKFCPNCGAEMGGADA